jgi:hypothetical protein
MSVAHTTMRLRRIRETDIYLTTAGQEIQLHIGQARVVMASPTSCHPACREDLLAEATAMRRLAAAAEQAAAALEKRANEPTRVAS